MEKVLGIFLAFIFSSIVFSGEIFTKDHNGNYGLDKFYINKTMANKFDYKHFIVCKSVFEEQAINNKEFFNEPFTITTNTLNNRIISISTAIKCTGKTLIPTYNVLRKDAIKVFELKDNEYKEYRKILKAEEYIFHEGGMYFLKNGFKVIISYNYLISKKDKLDAAIGDFPISVEIIKD